LAYVTKTKSKIFAKKAVSCSSTRMARVSKSFQTLVLGGMLVVGDPLVQSLSAQDGQRLGTGPSGLEIAYEWQYSCANGKGCSFNCPGSGGAANVTDLTMQLGTIPLGDKQTLGIFYEYSTMQIPRSNGFSITTGISTLSCQVNGMNLDYSGRPSDKPVETVGSRKDRERTPAAKQK
jgi:hypothetical protein